MKLTQAAKAKFNAGNFPNMLLNEVKIESITLNPNTSYVADKFVLEAPQIQQRLQGHHVVIAGWLVSNKAIDTHHICVIEKDSILKRAKLNVQRPDIAEKLDSNETNIPIGFHFEFSTIGLPPQFEFQLRLQFSDNTNSARSINLCRILGSKISYLNLPTKYSPIHVTAIGRSGTTLLMQVLGLHPEVLVTNFYPYEIRQAGYWLHFFKATTAPADFEDSSHPDKFEADRFHIGHNPYSHPEYINQYKNPQAAQEYYTNTTHAALAQLCINQIDNYYKLISEQEQKPKAKFFAEKFIPNQTQYISQDIYKTTKEIILTRDFRDILCSAQSFNKKRNSLSFGRDKANNDFEWIDNLAVAGARRLTDAFQERSHLALHVRYEDLIKNPSEQILRIFEYLEIEHTTKLIDLIIKQVFSKESDIKTHSTTSSPQASIGRWKTDMPNELQKHCEERLGYALRTFGYTV